MRKKAREHPKQKDSIAASSFRLSPQRRHDAWKQGRRRPSRLLSPTRHSTRIGGFCQLGDREKLAPLLNLGVSNEAFWRSTMAVSEDVLKLVQTVERLPLEDQQKFFK